MENCKTVLYCSEYCSRYSVTQPAEFNLLDIITSLRHAHLYIQRTNICKEVTRILNFVESFYFCGYKTKRLYDSCESSISGMSLINKVSRVMTISLIISAIQINNIDKNKLNLETSQTTLKVFSKSCIAYDILGTHK